MPNKTYFKNLAGKEDIAFDINRSNETFARMASDGTEIQITKINARHIPLTNAFNWDDIDNVEDALIRTKEFFDLFIVSDLGLPKNRIDVEYVGNTVEVDWDKAGFFDFGTLASNISVNFVNISQGQTIVLEITKQLNYQVTFPSSVVILENGVLNDGFNYIIITANDGVVQQTAVIQDAIQTTAIGAAQQQVSQAGHGFVLFDAIAYTGLAFVKSIAVISQSPDVIGIVSQVLDDDNFIVTYNGIIFYEDAQNPPFQLGNNIWLSPTNAGQLVDQEPTYITGDVRQYCGEALDIGILVNIAQGVGFTDDETLGLDNKNLVIDGQLHHWDLGAGPFSANGYTSTMISATFNGATGSSSNRQAFTVGQTDVNDNPKYFIDIGFTSVDPATGFITLLSKIDDVTFLSGKTVTVSFDAKGSIDGDIGVYFQQNFGTGGSPSLGVDTPSAELLPITSSWNKYSVTVEIPSVTGKTLGTNGNDWTALRIATYHGTDATIFPVNPLYEGTLDVANISCVIGSAAFQGPWPTADEERSRILSFFEVIGDYEEGVEGLVSSLIIGSYTDNGNNTSRRETFNYHKKVQKPAVTLGSQQSVSGQLAANNVTRSSLNIEGTSTGTAVETALSHMIIDARL